MFLTFNPFHSLMISNMVCSYKKRVIYTQYTVFTHRNKDINQKLQNKIKMHKKKIKTTTNKYNRKTIYSLFSFLMTVNKQKNDIYLLCIIFVIIIPFRKIKNFVSHEYFLHCRYFCLTKY